MSDKKKMKFVSWKLKGHVLVWWNQVQVKRTRKKKEKLGHGSEWQKNLKKNFFHLITIQLFLKNFIICDNITNPCINIGKSFTCSKFNDLREDEEQNVARYVSMLILFRIMYSFMIKCV